MGNALASRSESSSTCLPHGSLHEHFYKGSEEAPESWLFSTLRSSPPSASVAASLGLRGPKLFNRVLSVEEVSWCSEPLKEAGPLQNLSPRAPLRTRRRLEGLAGPSGSEVGHSYVIVKVLTQETKDSEPQSELWRLNWGQGRTRGANLTIAEDGVELPPERIMGERLERTWPGTCSGDQLLALLQRWDGRAYDVNPRNQRNCHHFVQDVLRECTGSRTSRMDPRWVDLAAAGS